MTDVKNQKLCGSCWAMATAAALESHHFLKTKDLLSLSAQNLVDCAPSYLNLGCQGGAISGALDYVRDNGIYTEESDPYAAYKHNYCKLGDKSNLKIDGFKRVQRGNERELQIALAMYGPIIVTIDGGGESFSYFYGNGIYNNQYCRSDALSHAVLLVGYGTDNHGRDYYIIKNSWGTSWGDHGYFKLPRNENNYCGIATDSYVPYTSSYPSFTSISTYSSPSPSPIHFRVPSPPLPDPPRPDPSPSPSPSSDSFFDAIVNDVVSWFTSE